MKITNKLHLPQAFVQMAQSDYTAEENEWRVTSLLKGVREAILERRHDGEIEQDVSDMIWMLFGTAVHGVLEQSEEGEEEFHEERLRVPIGSYMLSGKFDSYDASTKTITDYKTCSTWKVIFGDFSDWRRQTLIYAWMLREIGLETKQTQVVALMKDHSKSKAKFDKDYPQLPVKVITFKVRKEDLDLIGDWLKDRFKLIDSLKVVPDDALPVCDAQERYNSGTKYAVMQKGKKRAVRVYDSIEEADAAVFRGMGDEVEIRPGEDKKCAEYCSAAPFCSYWKSHGGKRK